MIGLASTSTQLRAIVLASLALAQGACSGTRDLAWTVSFDTDARAEAAVIVEGSVLRGGCGSGDVIATVRVERGESAPMRPPALTEGRVGIAATAIDRACVRFAAGCVELDLSGSAPPAIEVRLAPIDATRLCALDRCTTGRCDVADAGAALCASPVITSVSAGTAHSCAIAEGGGLHCWGADDVGQLGTGTVRGESRVAVAVAPERAFVAVGVGAAHTCAIADDGGLHCWGANDRGQLGLADRVARATPTEVDPGTVWTQISCGHFHTCGRRGDGTVACWGANDHGQLGTDEGTDALAPLTLDGVPDGAIDVGADHGCALGADGAACWGSHEDGRLGREGDRPVIGALAMPATDAWIAIAAGDRHGCGITADLRAWCWGRGADGQLGTGTTDDAALPTRVALDAAEVSAIGAGSAHSCALTAGRALLCWGSAADGRLGNRAEGTRVPVAVDPGPHASIAVGHSHGCAIDATAGVLRCWGRNTRGQLGSGRGAPGVGDLEPVCF